MPITALGGPGLSDLGRSDLANHLGGQAAEPLRGDVPGTAVGLAGRLMRWPEFAMAAAAAGIMSTLSLPLVVAGDGLGAVNIYCHEEHGFSEVDDALAMTLASYASVALANARVEATFQRFRQWPCFVSPRLDIRPD